jgi:ferritin-like protein
MMLAEETGHVDVDAMLELLTPQQFDEWMAYYVIRYDAKLNEPDSIQQSLKQFRGMAGV